MLNPLRAICLTIGNETMARGGLQPPRLQPGVAETLERRPVQSLEQAAGIHGDHA